MEGNDLINFNVNEHFLTELNSPVLPFSEKDSGHYKSRLSDVNNPFDNVLRKTMKYSLDLTNEECKQNTQCEEKENLSSPFQTSKKLNKKQIKICATPLYLGDTNIDNQVVARKDLDIIIDLNNSKYSDHNNSSLQCFDESFLNGTLNCALIASNVDFSQEESSKVKENSDSNSNLLSFDAISNKSTDIIRRPRNTQATSFSSFDAESFLNYNEISKISSNYSGGASNVFEEGFILSNTNTQHNQPFRRRCTSASKPQKTNQCYTYTARKQLNNSFGGFESEFDLKHDIVLEECIKSRKQGDVSIVQAALDGKYFLLFILKITCKI